MQMYMIQICRNIYVILSKAAHEYKVPYQLFGYLPRSHVDATIKGWPTNHVRGCILKELLVLFIFICSQSFLTQGLYF